MNCPDCKPANPMHPSGLTGEAGSLRQEWQCHLCGYTLNQPAIAAPARRCADVFSRGQPLSGRR